MLFVRERSHMPVPRVYGLYSKNNKNYIVMERIAGPTLLSLWPNLQHSEKEGITRLLRVDVDELRNLPAPNYYGSLGQRALLDGTFWTRNPSPAINGPFTSDEALTEAR
jgi:serine/threonine protein kinase